MESKEKVLITGGTGFIGSHVACEFVENGYKVMTISRSAKSHNNQFNKYVESGDIEILKGDVVDFDYNAIGYVDYIVHIAGKVSAYGKMKDFMKINYYGTQKILDYAKNIKPKCFTYYSSTAVYGYYGYTSLKEDAEKKPFNNPYSITKLKTENLVKEFLTNQKIDYVIIRPGNVYGEYDYTSSYDIYTRIKKQKMLICANGKYKSCFVYAKNLANATYLATTLKKAHNTDYNVTDGNNETLKEMFTCIANNFKVKDRFINFPSFLSKIVATVVEGTYKILNIKKAPKITKFTVWQNCCDYNFSIDKIKSIGYTPKYTQQEGVKNTCDWINSLEEKK